MAQNLESARRWDYHSWDFTDIREGDTIRRTGKIMEVWGQPGRVVDPLGRPVDGLGDIHTDKTRPVAPARRYVIKSVSETIANRFESYWRPCSDGRGQRELIIGVTADRKTTIAIGYNLEPKGQDMSVFDVVDKRINSSHK